jgi:hypothetical protein
VSFCLFCKTSAKVSQCLFMLSPLPSRLLQAAFG